MLRTSLHKGINQLTLEFLASILVSSGFRMVLVADCFKIFTSSISVTSDNRVVVLQGSEQLAETAAACLLGTLSHSLILDPKSKILKDVQQQYNRTFPPGVDLKSLSFHCTINGVHNLFNRYDHSKGLSWKGVDPSTPENLSLGHSLVKVASLCSQGLGLGQEGRKKVPRWVLRFCLHCLLYPNPPVSVVADCLLIVAIDLGCDIPGSDIRLLDKRCVCLAHLHGSSP